VNTAVKKVNVKNAGDPRCVNMADNGNNARNAVDLRSVCTAGIVHAARSVEEKGI
jgi:hypothetical protein